jgi:hypothetical protein
LATAATKSIKFATKAAFDHFFYRYTQLGEHLSDNNRIDQIFTLIVGDETDTHVALDQALCQRCQGRCFAGSQKTARKDELYGFFD